MFGRFLRDRSGGYAIMTVLLMVPLLGGLALAIDYTELSRQRQATLNALDAANIATAKYIIAGATDEQAKAYARQFFDANLGSLDTGPATISVLLPKNNAAGGGTLKMTAIYQYEPHFFPTFQKLLFGAASQEYIGFSAQSEVRLKNTIEVALALDNSGSMEEIGTGSGKKRIELLKSAAKDLVDTLANQAELMKQVAEPVRFSLVPFAASVNVGTDNSSASWMDTTGISPVHHENLNWSKMTSDLNASQYAQQAGSAWYARGSGWGTLRDEPLSRFTVFGRMKRVSSKVQMNSGANCTGTYSGGNCYTYAAATEWAGCVEARPYPYNVNDTAPSTGTPATLFVPMFAPDETDLDETSNNKRPANNDWWSDKTTSSNNGVRQAYTPKYFDPGTEVRPFYGKDVGPNISCSTKPITPLTDVSKAAGLDKIKDAIDEMTPGGATNVPEGLAWGWRTISSGAPFADGRPDTERGNDKIVIVLTDGANTYYTPNTVRAQPYSGPNWQYGGHDLAGNKSLYSAYGYPGTKYENGTTRIFRGLSSSFNKSDFSNANYGKAMNEHFATLCDNAKDGNVILMTVSLDLNEGNSAEKAQMDALKACASESRVRKEADGSAKKLYWNANGGDLADTFKAIADELSNLRIVS